MNQSPIPSAVPVVCPGAPQRLRHKDVPLLNLQCARALVFDDENEYKCPGAPRRKISNKAVRVLGIDPSVARGLDFDWDDDAFSTPPARSNYYAECPGAPKRQRGNHTARLPARALTFDDDVTPF